MWMLPKSSIRGTLNWRQSISHHITSLSRNAYFMSGRCMWNCKGSFVKSSVLEDRTCFAENNLWLTLNLKHVYWFMFFGASGCSCVFMYICFKIYMIYHIYETHIISCKAWEHVSHLEHLTGQKFTWNSFATWQAWKVFGIDSVF